MSKEKKFSCTLSLNALDKKIDVANYPTVIFTIEKINEKTGKKEIIEYTDCDAKFKVFQYCWFRTFDLTLNEFLQHITSDRLSFCPALLKRKKQTKYDVGYYTTLEYDAWLNGEYLQAYPKKGSMCYPYSDICPAENHAWRSKMNFEHSQMIVIDIDHGYKTITEVLTKVKDSFLKDCSFIYTTPNHSDNNVRLRVGWLLDETITNIKEYEKLVAHIVNLFGADVQCVDGARMFFFGKEVVYKNTQYSLNKQTIIDNILENKKILESKDKKNVTLIRPNIYKSYDNNEINSKDINNQLDNITNNHCEINFTDYFTRLGYYNRNNKIENFNFDNIYGSSNLMKRFKTKHLHYHELFCIISNFYYICGGLIHVKNVMDANNETGVSHYNSSDFQLLKNQKIYKYAPEGFITHNGTIINEADAFYYKNLLEAGAPKVNKSYQVKTDYSYMKSNRLPIEESQNILSDFFNSIIAKRNDTDIHIIQAPIGLGKTKLLESIARRGYVLAFQTHALKDEVGDRIDDYELKAIKEIFPDQTDIIGSMKRTVKMELLTPTNQAKLESLYEMGNPLAIKHFLNEVKKSKTEDAKKIKKYQSALYSAIENDTTIVTTHTLAKMGVFCSHHTYIFDEDPFPFDVGHLYPKDIEFLLSFRNKGNREYDKFINSVVGKIDCCIVNEITNQSVLDLKVKTEIITFIQNEKGYNKRIKDFFECNNYCLRLATPQDYVDVKQMTQYEALLAKGLFYSVKWGFPSDKKIIILSATIDESIYRAAYGDRVKFYKVPDTEMKGTIMQDTRYSFTRYSMEQDNTKKYLRANVNRALPTISYKNDEPDMWFYNVCGYDGLKGQDINVIGTPLLPSWCYVLLAKAIGYDIKYINQEYKEQRCKYNGYEFHFNTFTDPILQRLQFSLINSELVQAVGRCRALRELATAHLYSGFPICDAIQKYLIDDFKEEFVSIN
ncbi:hypothetical protein MEO93_20885 [Dolichospermum sp. ST_sed3]|nr:hypothetical protein [Dolichospermum sp. ST_sed3]